MALVRKIFRRAAKVAVRVAGVDVRRHAGGRNFGYGRDWLIPQGLVSPTIKPTLLFQRKADVEQLEPEPFPVV
jgi:hypothetical protein